MTDFKREDRYIVIKRSDFITEQDEKALRAWLEKFHVPIRECVVVESNWPMHEAQDLIDRIGMALDDPAPTSDGGTTPERLEELLEEAVPILRAVAGQQGETSCS